MALHPLPFKYMKLSKEDVRIARKKVQDLRKNPTRTTEADRQGAKEMFKKHEAFEKEKDDDIARDRKAVSKDLAGFFYNHTQGVGELFHGIGEGKKAYCSFPDCGVHEGEMFNMKDGKWYCRGHRDFGNLTEEQKEKECCHA